MITIPKPAMVVNAPGLFPYRMDSGTYTVPTNMSAQRLASLIDATAAVIMSTEGKLATLVIHCHGLMDRETRKKFVGLGLGTEIWQEDLAAFSIMYAMVQRIWITSCKAAAGATGIKFCQTLARNTRAEVVAGDIDQSTERSEYQELLKGNRIDNYEGNAYLFDKVGNYSIIYPNDK